MTLVFSTFFVVQSAIAIEVTKLNEASVMVNSRSAKDRQLGLKQALSNVIIKNSGSVDSLTNPLVVNELQDPNSFLVQYGYFEQDDQLMLRGEFEPRRITNLLRQADLPVWGKQRPLILFWLSTDINGQRKILNDASSSELRRDFRDAASAKGVPLIFPIMDLDDLMKVSEPDVRGIFPSAVLPATERYNADYFVLANIQTTQNGKLIYQLNLFQAGRNSNHDSLQSLYSANGFANSEEDAVEGMIYELTGYFVSQYAIADSGLDQGVYVMLHGIDQISQLVAIEKKIKQLSVVKSIHVAEINGNKVLLSLDLYGSTDDLKRQLNLEHMLKPVETFDLSEAATTPNPFEKPQITMLEYQVQ